MQFLLSVLISSAVFFCWSIDNYMSEKKYSRAELCKRFSVLFLVVLCVTSVYSTNCQTGGQSTVYHSTGSAPF